MLKETGEGDQCVDFCMLQYDRNTLEKRAMFLFDERSLSEMLGKQITFVTRTWNTFEQGKTRIEVSVCTKVNYIFCSRDV